MLCGASNGPEPKPNPFSPFLLPRWSGDSDLYRRGEPLSLKFDFIVLANSNRLPRSYRFPPSSSYLHYILYLLLESFTSSSMISCSLGAPKFRVSVTNFSRLRCRNLLIPNNQRLFIGQSPFKNLSLRTTLRSVKAIQLSAVSPAESQDVEDSDETNSSVVNTQLIPKSSEVEALISEIADSSFAEFELKLGGFRLYVARKLADQSSPLPQQIPHVVAAIATPEGINTNGSATSSSLAITKTSSSSDRPQTLANKAADEGLVILQSPTVGYFRRSKTIKGKRTPTICKEKDIVKEGKVLCYIEQLGGQIPVESDVSGEVVKILREDGEPVGYNDALIAILPSFPGIKKLQ